MPRGLISLKSSGLKEFIAELNGLAKKFPEYSKKSVQAQLSVVEEKIRVNWVSMVGGTPGGYVYNSVGQSTAFSKSNKTDIIGTVGIYHLDSVDSSFGKTEKDLNAAQIAYWVEFGTSRLRSGSRKVKGVEYSEENLVQVAAKSFTSNAFYTSLDEQQLAFKKKFNELIDEAE